MKKIIISILIANIFVLSSFGCVGAQEETSPMPQTMEEAKGLGLEILAAWPGAVKKVWREEAWPFILQMWSWVEEIWNSYIGYRVEAWWSQFLGLVGKEQPDLKKEFQKEREEMQKDAWERFKDLLE